jgi:hypothetical protein
LSQRLGLPAETVPEGTFGPSGSIFAMDQPSSSAGRARSGHEPASSAPPMHAQMLTSGNVLFDVSPGTARASRP